MCDHRVLTDSCPRVTHTWRTFYYLRVTRRPSGTCLRVYLRGQGTNSPSEWVSRSSKSEKTAGVCSSSLITTQQSCLFKVMVTSDSVALRTLTQGKCAVTVGSCYYCYCCYYHYPHLTDSTMSVFIGQNAVED